MSRHTKKDLFNQITNLIIKVSEQISNPTYGYIIMSRVSLYLHASQTAAQPKHTAQPPERSTQRNHSMGKNKENSHHKGAAQPQKPSEPL
jgi:hypothetical protein